MWHILIFIIFLQISIGNNEIKKINVKWLRKHIGIVNQEPILFDATIFENIQLGNPDATPEVIERAARNANAHEFIMSMPQVYSQ